MLEISKFEDLQYVIRYPKNYKEGDKCPVLFFFHGSGSVGKDIELVTGNSFFTVTENIEDFRLFALLRNATEKRGLSLCKR